MADTDSKTPEPTPAESPTIERSPEGSRVVNPLPLQGIPRVVSLIVLLVVVLLIGVLFFRVMATFLVPLFLAAVLAVVFKPLHAWVFTKLEGRRQMAALSTTVLISLLVLVPTALLGWRATVETARIVRVALPDKGTANELAVELASPLIKAEPQAVAGVPVDPEGALSTNDDVASGENEPLVADASGGWAGWLRKKASPVIEWYPGDLKDQFDIEATGADIAEYAARSVVAWGLVGIQGVVSFLFGLAIMIFALYYFFADGPSIIESLMHLSPLDDDYERELLAQFATVSRAVVLATILSAVVQGLLAGVGYLFVLDEWSPPAVVAAAEAAGTAPETINPPLFLLTVLTMLLAIVPFVGATAVWVPVVAWVYFVQGDLWPAVGMAIYGAAVVSSIDNFIKPYVLHGQSNLHPLLALLSVLGGLQLLGPVGILVGPMLVAFLQALLGMLRKELDVLQAESESGADAPVPA